MDIYKLAAILSLEDRLSGPMAKVKGAMTSGGAIIAKVGLAAATALGGIGIAATGMAAEINSGMSEVSTLIPGQTERVLELKGAVQDLAVEYGTPTSGLVGGLYEAVSAFGDSAETVDILAINARAAKAGVAEVGEAIALTSAVTKGYNTVNAEGVQRAADLAFKTVELGQTNFPQLAKAIGQVVPLSAELGVTQEELFGVMATGTGVTGTASQVSTQLRGVLAGLMQPTAAMTGLYADMGVESGKALIEQEGLQGALVAVTGAAKASGEPLGKFLGSVEAQTLALALTGGQMDNWVSKTAAMEASAGSVDVAFGEMTGGINRTEFAVDQMKQQFTVWGQKAGQAVLDFTGDLGPAVLGVAQLGGAFTTMGPALTMVTANLGLGTLATKGLALAQGALNVVMSLNPIALVVIAIGLAVAAWVKWGDEITAFLGGAWDRLASGFKTMAGFLGFFKSDTDDAAESVGDLATAIEIGQSPGLTPALAGATAGIEAFNLEVAESPRVLAGATTRITTFAGYLEANTASLHTGALAWGFYVDEAEHQVVNRTPEIQQALLDMAEPPPAMPDQGSAAAAAWAQGFFGHLTASFQGGGGFMGGVKASITEGFGNLFAEGGALAPVAEKWGQALEAIGGIPVVGPFLQAFGPVMIQGVIAIGKKAWGALKGIFGGPSEEVVSARGSLEGFSGEVEQYVGRTESSTARLNDFIDSGWEQNRATVITFFQDQAIAAGKSAQEGTDHWLAYQAAMEAGNAELMGDLEQQALDWNDVNANSATESEEAWAASYTAQTVTSDTMTDEAIANSLRLKEAVVADTVEMLGSWTAMATGMQQSMAAMAASVTASLASIQDRTVTITTVHRTISEGGGGSGGGAAGGSGVAGRGSTIVVPVTIDGREVARASTTHSPEYQAFRGIDR